MIPIVASGLSSVVLLAAGAAPTVTLGEPVASNYRVEITGVAPAVGGLHVEIADIGGSIQLTWSGDGTLVVHGYEGEAYLRIAEGGVDRNVNSPATYLNRDRYAQTSAPPTASATAAPQWERVSTSHTVRWHDHRTHWMDRTAPSAVRANPDRATVVFPQWEIPLDVNGTPVTVTGRLTWIPPPNPLPWWVLTLAVGGAAAIAAFRSRSARLALAATTVTVFAIDSLGYLIESNGTFAAKSWYLVWPALTAALLVVATRDRGEVSLGASGACGMVVAMVGGIGRSGAVSNSQVYSALADWWTRLAAATCLGVGAALATVAITGLIRPLASRSSCG